MTQQFQSWEYILKKPKTLIRKDAHTRMFTAELFTIAKKWKQHKCPPTDEWIKKMWSICIGLAKRFVWFFPVRRL